MESIEKLKFPIGSLDTNPEQSEANRTKWKATIAALPQKLRAAVEYLNEEQLNTPYRPDGWTVRQVVHHVADSHMNAYIRFHWAMTEDEPIIKAYDQDGWAHMSDGLTAPLEPSLMIVDGIHLRLSYLLDRMTDEDFDKMLVHPDWKEPLSLGFMLSMYAWHSEHHLAHITHLAKRMSWTTK